MFLSALVRSAQTGASMRDKVDLAFSQIDGCTVWVSDSGRPRSIATYAEPLVAALSARNDEVAEYS